MVAAAPGSKRVRSSTVTPSSGRTLTVPLQLAAGGKNIATARLANKTLHRAPYDCLEREDPLRVRSLERNAGPGIQRAQVHLAIQIRQQLDHAARVGVAIVDASD